ncbi:MAG: hypothetical protein OEX01_02990 [Candidatus Bathyarchaeota archaeon]|nr:hypothetical protein [Candidatus Bathyarchaeota archaeon]
MVSLRTRITSTVVLVFCWLIFTISFLAFYQTGFDIWQNIAFFIVSALIVCGLIAAIWISMAF